MQVDVRPLQHPDGSALIHMGNTQVLCTVTYEANVPLWRKGKGSGWLTAEYALLPGSTHTRTPRSHISGGRTHEIQRLIGRSLRRAVDLDRLGEATLVVDCDVLQADGGTRTAAINGAYIALALALQHLASQGVVPLEALLPPIAAISVGIVAGHPMMDLSYEEDARAEIDLNVVMNAQQQFIEVQGTAEGHAIERATLDQLLDLATEGIRELTRVQREVLACAGIET